MSLTPMQYPLSSIPKGLWAAVVVIVVVVWRVPAEAVGTVLPVLAGVVALLLGQGHMQRQGGQQGAVNPAQ